MSSPRASSRKPWRVRLALWLLVLAILLSFVRDVLAWQELGPGISGHSSNISFLLGIMVWPWIVILTLFQLGLCSLIARGHHWARLLYLVYFLVSAFFFLGIFLDSISKVPVLATLSGWQYFLQGLALLLLFGGAAGRWFRPPSTPPPLPT